MRQARGHGAPDRRYPEVLCPRPLGLRARLQRRLALLRWNSLTLMKRHTPSVLLTMIGELPPILAGRPSGPRRAEYTQTTYASQDS